MLRIFFICFLLFSLHTAFSQQQLVGLETYVAAVETAILEKNKPVLAKAYSELGNFYFSKNAFEKAITNHQTAIKLFKEINNIQEQSSSLEIVGKSFLAITKYDKAIENYDILLAVYKQLNNVSGTEKTLENLIWATQNTNQPEKLLYHNVQLSEFAKKNNHFLLSAKAENNMGVYYMNDKNSPKALGHFKEALNIYKKNAQTEQLPLLLLNMGSCHVGQKEYDRADTYYLEAVKLYDNQGNKKGKALALNLIATNDLLQNKNEKALLAAKEAMTIATEQQADDVLEETYLVLSEIYNDEGDYKQSQNYYKLHLAIKEKLADAQRKKLQANVENEIQAVKAEGDVKLTVSEKAKQELALKQLVLEAEKNAKDLELKAKQVTVLEQEKRLQEQAYKNSVLEKQSLALEKQRIAKDLLLAQQQIEQDKTQQQIVMLEKDKEVQAAMQDLKSKEYEREKQASESAKRIQEHELENQQIKQFFITGILALVGLLLAFALFAFVKQRKANNLLKVQQIEIKEKNEELASNEEELRQNIEEMQAIQEQLQRQRDSLLVFNNEIQQQKEVIEDKNANIMASINYAKRIQNAFLPDKDMFRKNLPQGFIFFRPKDVVSGDFYWFAEYNGIFVVAAGDCTGHGVPGALVSMIGMNLLDDIVYSQNITNPSQVLTALDKGFKSQLQKPEVSINDGMDMSFCEINPTNKTLSFSAAHIPLILIQDGEVNYVKGSKGAIGGDDRFAKTFENHTFVIDKPTTCYLHSDGFQDQFGGSGEVKRKFLSKNLRNFLLEIHQNPFDEQAKSLGNIFDTWKDKEPQTDDVLVIGFKLS